MLSIDSTLAARLEDAQAWRAIRYAQAQARLRPETASAAEAVGGGYAVFAGPSSPVNGVRGLGMHGPVTAAHLEQIEARYAAFGCPAHVQVCPLADRSLLSLVQQRGYVLASFMNVLARRLDDEALFYTPPPTLTIRQTEPAQAEAWIRVTAQGFTGQDEPPASVLEILGPNVHSESAVCFLAWLGGQAVGGGGMYVHQKTVELGGASTRLPFRRRGVQAALLHMRLAAARRLGCDLALVCTSPGSDSQRNIERAGFSVAYTNAIVVHH